MSKRPAVVLVSGGLDSATALAEAIHHGFDAHALSFDYGQRHRCELTAAASVSRALHARSHKTIAVDLRAIGGSSLTDDIAVPKDRSESDMTREGSLPSTYVPARNLIFLSLAAGYAETLQSWDIFIGVNSVDYSGYPDCRAPFIQAFATAANLAVGAANSSFTIHTPLIHLTKVQIIRRGTALGVDFALTHSCYDPDSRGLACGHCDSCLIRKKGFAEAGLPDPTRYQDARR